MLKKLFVLFSFFVVSTLGIANAFTLPLDRDGVPALNVQDVGVYVFLSTSEVPWLVSGASQVLAGGWITGGSSIVIYGVLTSTFSGDIAAPAFVELRATNTANTTSELLVPPISIGVSSSSTGALHIPKNNLVVFDPPIVAGDQVSVNISSALGLLSTYRYSAAIFYRYLATNAPEEVWFPYDARGQKAVGGASLYGVKTGTGNTLGGAANDRQGTEEHDFILGPVFTQTSSQPADQGGQLLYGWSASTGNASSWFQIDDATGIGDNGGMNVGVSSFSFLPRIYPRTLGIGFENYPWNHTPITGNIAITTNFEFNFPWPLIARKGLRFTASTAAERYRLKVRNRRALR